MTTGPHKLTCKEAVRLLAEGKLDKVHWRPHGINYHDLDNDIVYVWYEGETDEVQQSDNARSE